MKSERKGKGKMSGLLWFGAGLGAVALVGCAVHYIIGLVKGKDTDNADQENQKLFKTEKEDTDKAKDITDIEELKKLCWKSYKEKSFCEKRSEYYRSAFSGTNILYYTQRIMGVWHSERTKADEQNIKYIINNINTPIFLLENKLSRVEETLMTTEEAFFANGFYKINEESLKAKLEELNFRITEIKNELGYQFYKVLYEETAPVYNRLLKEMKESGIDEKKTDGILKEIEEIYENRGIYFIYAEDASDEERAELFDTNPDDDNLPAIILASGTEVLYKGNIKER